MNILKEIVAYAAMALGCLLLAGGVILIVTSELTGFGLVIEAFLVFCGAENL